MSRRDTEKLELEKWVQQLGYFGQLQPQEEHRLLAPNTRPVQRHLQRHVKPVQLVQTIRKNLLLAKLQRENIQPDQIRNFKIQSCEEFSLAERVSNIQHQIDSKNNQKKAIDNEIKTIMYNIGEKKYNIISKEKQIKETENKTALLSLKLSHVKKGIEQLKEYTSKANLLKTMLVSNSYLEESSTLSNIATTLMSNKLTLLTDLSEEGKALLLNLSIQYPKNIIYRAFLLASDSVAKSLKGFVMNLNNFDESVKENLALSETSSFSYHLKHLNSLVIQNQLNIANCMEKVRDGSTLLEKEKIELMERIKEMCSNSSTNVYENAIDVLNVEADEFVNMFVNNTLSSNKAVKLKELTEQILSECSEYDHLKCQIEDSKERQNELDEEVNKKVSLINELYSKMFNYNPKVNHLKDNIVQMCNKSVSNFLTEINKQKECEDVFFASEDLISKEIKMFVGAPLCGLTRSWEDSYELLSKELMEYLSVYPELRMFLLQSEPTNILNSILEKKFWSEYH